MEFQLIYTPAAQLMLAALPRTLADRIATKVEWYCAQANPLQFAEALAGEFKSLYRFRVGDYRVIFARQSNGELTIILITRVRHRSRAYDP